MSSTNLGFILSSMASTSSYETMILKGALKYAKKTGIDIICFEGGLLEYSPYNAFEYQRNKIYDLVKSKKIKGIVIHVQ